MNGDFKHTYTHKHGKFICTAVRIDFFFELECPKDGKVPIGWHDLNLTLSNLKQDGFQLQTECASWKPFGGYQ